jgi:hypothetical protein
MRLKLSLWKLVLGIGLALGSGAAEIVDRIDVVVDGQAIKQSDILEDIRVTEFLNKAKLDLGLAPQKEAVNRLIDQKLIRKAMQSGLYPVPDRSEMEPLLEQVRRRYPDHAAYRRDLALYGLTEDVLKAHLLWQIAVINFIGLRFQTASEGNGSAASNATATNQQFFAWLDQSRKDARIDFKRADLREDRP